MTSRRYPVTLGKWLLRRALGPPSVEDRRLGSALGSKVLAVLAVPGPLGLARSAISWTTMVSFLGCSVALVWHCTRQPMYFSICVPGTPVRRLCFIEGAYHDHVRHMRNQCATFGSEKKMINAAYVELLRCYRSYSSFLIALLRARYSMRVARYLKP